MSDALRERAWRELETSQYVAIVRVTPDRRGWLSGAAPTDHYGVTFNEGGEFTYGPTLQDAILKWSDAA